MQHREAKRLLSLILFGVLLSFSYAVSHSRSENETKRVHAQHYANCSFQNDEAHDSLAPPAKQTLSVNISCQWNAEQREEEGTEFWPPLFGWRFKITDTLLVVFTGLLWLATRDLVNDASRASKRQLRAYVHFLKGAIVDVDFARQPRAQVRIKNYGSTPAHIKNWAIGFDFSAIAAENELPAPITAAQNTALAPGGTIFRRITWANTISGEQAHAIEAGTSAIYVYGFIDYIDVFGGTCVTNFRFYYAGHIDGNGVPILEMSRAGNITT